MGSSWLSIRFSAWGFLLQWVL